MGTHPIFESDFDCLTVECVMSNEHGDYAGGGGENGQQQQANVLDVANVHDQSAVRSFIGQGSHHPPALPLSARTNSDLIHCSSQNSSMLGRTATQFQSEKHSLKLLSSLNRFRASGYLCDVTLKIQARQFHAHKTILASSSPYFEAMFTSCMEESQMSEVEIKDVSPEAMELLIDFCYTTTITIEEDNVQQLLPAACLLQMSQVQQYCCEFLSKQLHPSNCLGIRAFADRHSCNELLNISQTYTAQHFEEVSQSEEYLLLPIEQLVNILSSDELNVKSEEDVFKAAMDWMNYDLAARKCHLQRVFENVRFPLMTAKFLVGTVDKNQLIRTEGACRDLVDEAKNYLLLPQERGHMQGPRTRPRRPVNPYEVLFAVGGWCSGDAIQTVERYDPIREEWCLVESMNKRRCGVGVAVLDNYVYAIGGHDGTSYLQTVEKYDPIQDNWSTDVATTSTCRTSVGVAVLDGYLYAIGGQDGGSCLDLVERYDPINNRWERKASMKTRRLGVGVAVLNKFVYAVGGSNGGTPWDSVERYNPANDTWTSVASMSTARKHLGCAVYQDFIYAVGGRDDTTELNSVERYSDKDNCWKPVVAMQTKRSGVGLAVVGGQLLAVGGFDGVNYLKTVEIFNHNASNWILCGNTGSMHYRRLGGGVGVVKLKQPFAYDRSSTMPILRKDKKKYS